MSNLQHEHDEEAGRYPVRLDVVDHIRLNVGVRLWCVCMNSNEKLLILVQGENMFILNKARSQTALQETVRCSCRCTNLK